MNEVAIMCDKLGLDVWEVVENELLRAKGADVRYHDPYVPAIFHNGYAIQGEPDLDVALAMTDCAVVLTDHSSYNWAAIRQKARLVVDTRNAMDQALEKTAWKSATALV